MILRAMSLLTAGISVAAAVTLAISPAALARSPAAASKIAIHVVFKGSYKHVETLRATERVSRRAPDSDSLGCLALTHGSLSIFFVHVLVSSGLVNINEAKITIGNYRPSTTTYGAMSSPIPSTHMGTGAQLSFEVIPPLHFFSTRGSSRVRVQLSKVA